jgi:Bacterial Ig-like domain (group 3)
MPVGIVSTNRRRLTYMAATAVALLAGAGASILCIGVSSAAAAPVTCAAGTCSLTFSQAGATTQEWVVPNGLSEAAFVVNGAGGGSDTYGGNGGPGGNGARVTGTIPVIGGQSLQLLVGTGGERTESTQGADGGYGGGGDGGTGIELGAAGGGGGSFVFRAGTPLIIAGGGGGAAVEGLEGGDGGQIGADGGNYESYAGGEGAKQSAPGAGGRGIATGASGTGPTTGLGALAEGGAGEGAGAKFAGGGGGGGYYGGGGGGGGGTGSLSNEYSNTGGGGGSSYVASGSGIAYSSGGGAGGYGFENFNEESEEVAAEAGSITISFAQPVTSTSLAATSPSPTTGDPDTITATVSPVPSSGTVAFTEGGSTITGCGAVVVDGNGEASCTTDYSSPGTYELLGEYSGSTDTVYPASSSAPLNVTATSPAAPPAPPTPTSTTLAASSTTPTVSAPVTFTATVSPTPDSGTVAFDDGAGTIPGCAAVPVNVSTGIATCATSFSTSGAHAMTAAFSGSVDATFTPSASEPVQVSVTPSTPSTSGVVSTASTASTPTPTPSQAPATTSPPTFTAPSPAPVFALTILTREAKPLINRRLLSVRARCGMVACTMRASMTIELPGTRRALSLDSPSATVPVGEAENALIAVPSKLRSVVRSYLLHHHHAAITLQLTVTASAAGQVPQSADVTIPMWTYAGYR